MDKASLEHSCALIIRRCEKLNFPLFSNVEKRKTLLTQYAKQIDAAFDDILHNEKISLPELTEQRKRFWGQATTDARKEFSNIDDKHLFNGFYLQEVTHRYAELQADFILERL